MGRKINITGKSVPHIGSSGEDQHPVSTPTTSGFMDFSDKSKIDGIENNADVTDATNVSAAGAAMTSNDLSDLSNASTARTNLGLGTAATESDTRYAIRSNNLSDLSDANAAKTNLGLNNVTNDAQLAKDGSVVATGTLDMGGNSVIGATFSISAKGSGNYTLVSSDNGKLIHGYNGTWTVPDNTFPVGTTITIMQTGAGQITFASGANQTINNRQGHTKTAAQYAVVALTQYLSDTWILTGDTA